jgi:hypothetical protein
MRNQGERRQLFAQFRVNKGDRKENMSDQCCKTFLPPNKLERLTATKPDEQGL